MGTPEILLSLKRETLNDESRVALLPRCVHIVYNLLTIEGGRGSNKYFEQRIKYLIHVVNGYEYLLSTQWTSLSVVFSMTDLNCISLSSPLATDEPLIA